MTSDAGTIVVVEDDPNIGDLVELYLRREDYRVLQATDARQALEVVARERPRLVVLDLGLPGHQDGLDVCRRLRDNGRVPVLILTARDSELDRVLGLELGADDYVTKPFSPRELATRVKTVLRRARPSSPPRERISIGRVVVDAAEREARRDGEMLNLTAKEFDLLWFLASNPNRVFSRDQLMNRVWGYASALDTGTVTVHVRRLREKLEDDASRPQLLETVWGVGYRLRA